MTKYIRLLSFAIGILFVVAAMLGVTGSLGLPHEAYAAPIAPDQVSAPGAIFVVTNTNDSGVGSLRQAILNANNNPGADTITFNIVAFPPVPQVFTISPLTPLPPIAGPVTIDGTTEGGGHCHLSLGHPCIVLDGTSAGASAIGLTVSSPSGSTVRGLVINHFVIGIQLSGYGGSHVEGSYIGTNVTGTAAAANGVGIVIDSSTNNTIGGTTAGARNLISGNMNYGVVIETASGNVVAGNLIGTDISGTTALSNRIGVFMTNASNNIIGGAQAGAGNVIAGNQVGDGVGVWIGGSSSTSNVVAGNTIGANVHGSASLANRTGVRIDGSPGNTIGGTTPGARNLISGNNTDGIVIKGAGRNVVTGNYIGTNVTGTAALPNQVGVHVDNAPANTIGGTAPGARNLISGNHSGVSIVGSTATTNTVAGNTIGTDVNGTVALPNVIGIEISDAAGNTVGGTTAGARNLISGNSLEGVFIDGTFASGNVIEGNFVGTNVTGITAIPNLHGILIGDSSNNLIGGTAANARNLISGNNAEGIGIVGTIASTSGNVVQGNFIGTNANGTATLPNSIGVEISDASGNTIGGTTAGAPNVVSGNADYGVFIAGISASENVVQGNTIGTDLAGNLVLGNAVGGIGIFDGSHNLIGGSAAEARNTIVFNGGNGITIRNVISDTAIDNAIRHNSIFSNTLLGIDLGGDGVTANDIGDADAGPNTLQNYPALNSAVSLGNNLSVAGILTSKPSAAFTVEFFANRGCDASGHGEGESFIGSLPVTTDSNGDASFNTVLASSVSTGQFVTATATDLNGNTSEFSKCVTVAPPLEVYLPLVIR